MGQSKSAARREKGQAATPGAVDDAPEHKNPAADRDGRLPDALSASSLAGCERLGDPFDSQVWRYNSTTIAKRGDKTAWAAEVSALRFVQEKSSVPVPRVLGTAVDADDESAAWVFLEHIDGDQLDQAWAACTAAERDSILDQLKGFLAELRTFRGDFVGAVGRTACHDQIFLNSGGPYASSKDRFGPYDNEETFRDGIAEALRHCDADPAFTEVVVGLVKAMPEVPVDDEGPPFVITHGDLVPRNILVRGGTVVGIIDWEMAGFYPKYWEYAKSHFFPDYEHPWMVERALDKILDPYPVQMGLLLHTRKIFYF